MDSNVPRGASVSSPLSELSFSGDDTASVSSLSSSASASSAGNAQQDDSLSVVSREDVAQVSAPGLRATERPQRQPVPVVAPLHHAPSGHSGSPPRQPTPPRERALLAADFVRPKHVSEQLDAVPVLPSTSAFQHSPVASGPPHSPVYAHEAQSAADASPSSPVRTSIAVDRGHHSHPRNRTGQPFSGVDKKIERDMYGQRLAALADQLHSVQSQYDTRLRSIVDAHAREMQTLHAQVNDYEQRLQFLVHQQRENAQHVRSPERQPQHALAQVQQAQSKIDSLELKVAELQEKLDLSRVLNEQISQQLQENVKALENKDQEVQRLSAELVHLRTATAQPGTSQIEQEMQSLRLHQLELERELQALRRERSAQTTSSARAPRPFHPQGAITNGVFHRRRADAAVAGVYDSAGADEVHGPTSGIPLRLTQSQRLPPRQRTAKLTAPRSADTNTVRGPATSSTPPGQRHSKRSHLKQMQSSSMAASLAWKNPNSTAGNASPPRRAAPQQQVPLTSSPARAAGALHASGARAGAHPKRGLSVHKARQHKHYYHTPLVPVSQGSLASHSPGSAPNRTQQRDVTPSVLELSDDEVERAFADAFRDMGTSLADHEHFAAPAQASPAQSIASANHHAHSRNQQGVLSGHAAPQRHLQTSAQLFGGQPHSGTALPQSTSILADDAGRAVARVQGHGTHVQATSPVKDRADRRVRTSVRVTNSKAASDIPPFATDSAQSELEQLREGLDKHILALQIEKRELQAEADKFPDHIKRRAQRQRKAQVTQRLEELSLLIVQQRKQLKALGGPL